MTRDEIRMKLWVDCYCSQLSGDRTENADEAIAAFDAKFPEPEPEILPQAVG